MINLRFHLPVGVVNEVFDHTEFVFSQRMTTFDRKGIMDFIRGDIAAYADVHTENEPQLLYDLNRDTHLHVMKPRMLSGHYQGRLLSMISHMIQPKRILELGTYTGYSALCLAEGMTKDGELITIDLNEELEDRTSTYFAKSQYSEQIRMIIGDAMKIVPTLKSEFDLVFIDADKVNYLNYYEMVLAKVRPGGFILIDNVLWSGKVLETPKKGDHDTQVLIALNDYIHKDERVQEVLLPVRDGLFLIRKKSENK